MKNGVCHQGMLKLTLPTFIKFFRCIIVIFVMATLTAFKSLGPFPFLQPFFTNIFSRKSFFKFF